ncbi:MAG: (Fe-S)-binding protein [Desulfobacterales bacterium]|jgi:L-lactate dehydrogenase complex protein LldE
MRIYPPKPETVYFFGTCLVDMVYPDAGMAAIRLLQREGLRVVYPPAQSCCGQPAFNSGFPDEARAVARKQLHLFPKDYPIVVPSGSCAGMMHRHYPALFAGDPDLALAAEFAGRVFELTEFLVHVLKIQLEDRGAPVTVTWHSSCHALREMGVIQDSKSLIRQLRHVTLLEIENEHECCGFGGTFAVKQPEISAAMVADKAADIRNTGAATVLGGDCGCLMNISGALQHQRVPITGQHIAQFIWERING